MFSDVSSGTALNRLSWLRPSNLFLSLTRFDNRFWCEPVCVRLSILTFWLNSSPSCFSFLDVSFLNVAFSFESKT